MEKKTNTQLNGKTDSFCSICLDPFYIRKNTNILLLSNDDMEIYNKGEPIFTPCFHNFHGECIKKHLITSYENYCKYSMNNISPYKCPLCKSLIKDIKSYVQHINYNLESIGKYDHNNPDASENLEEIDNVYGNTDDNNENIENIENTEITDNSSIIIRNVASQTRRWLRRISSRISPSNIPDEMKEELDLAGARALILLALNNREINSINEDGTTDNDITENNNSENNNSENNNMNINENESTVNSEEKVSLDDPLVSNSRLYDILVRLRNE